MPASALGLYLLLVVLLTPVGGLHAAAPPDPGEGPARYVILISVDGLRPDAIRRHSPEQLPNFYRLRREGAFTDNARTDADFSVTLPNHLAQLTGRPVLGAAGHSWTSNGDPADGETLHTRKGAYVASAFDVVHDEGLRTGAYASKSKFVLLDRSYGEAHGAPDRTGEDNGRDKIDTFVYEKSTKALVARFVRDMQADPFNFAFVHLRDPDSKGHLWGWSLWRFGPYMRAIRRVDALVGQILDLVERDPRLAGNTVVILTADHGGSGHHHDAAEPAHYTIPFYAWGAGIPNRDLYVLNTGTRKDPGTGHPGFGAGPQPIRNGGAANLALALLGLEPIPGSAINAQHRFSVGRVAMPGVNTASSR